MAPQNAGLPAASCAARCSNATDTVASSAVGDRGITSTSKHHVHHVILAHGRTDGTGKSHLLIGLGTAAAQQGFRVRYAWPRSWSTSWWRPPMNDERQLVKTIARYGRVDLLCIDEFGYMELDRRGAELLFQVLTEREEQR